MSERKRREHKPDPIRQHDPVYGCVGGKIGYHSRSQAKRAGKHARKAGRTIKSVYRCPLCPHWHTTSQVPRTTI